MPKRFTDTDKWKKGFIRSLDGAYKLLWFYILDDCDHAGIWQVDFEVARIRIGEQVEKQTALNLFAGRIEVINNGSKWFLRDFIDFQYGELNDKNRMHLSVINILKKNNISPIGSPFQGAKDMDKDKDKVKDQDKDKDKEGDFDSLFLRAFDEMTCERFQMTFQNIPPADLRAELQQFRTKCDNDPVGYHSRDEAGLRTAFQYQLKQYRSNGKRTSTIDQDRLNDLIEARHGSKGAGTKGGS